MFNINKFICVRLKDYIPLQTKIVVKACNKTFELNLRPQHSLSLLYTTVRQNIGDAPFFLVSGGRKLRESSQSVGEAL